MKELSNNFKRYFRVYLSIEKKTLINICVPVCTFKKFSPSLVQNLDALLNHLIIFLFLKKKKIEKISTDIEFMKAHVIP